MTKTILSYRQGLCQIVILKLSLEPSTGSFGFTHIRTTGTSTVQSLSWTLDGNFVAMAHRSDLVTLWNWRENQWGVTLLQAEEGMEAVSSQATLIIPIL